MIEAGIIKKGIKFIRKIVFLIPQAGFSDQKREKKESIIKRVSIKKNRSSLKFNFLQTRPNKIHKKNNIIASILIEATSKLLEGLSANCIGIKKIENKKSLYIMVGL